MSRFYPFYYLVVNNNSTCYSRLTFPPFLSFFFAFLPWSFYLFLPLRRSENFFVFILSFRNLPVSRWNKFLFHNFGISVPLYVSPSLFWLSKQDVY